MAHLHHLEPPGVDEVRSQQIDRVRRLSLDVILNGRGKTGSELAAVISASPRPRREFWPKVRLAPNATSFTNLAVTVVDAM